MSEKIFIALDALLNAFATSAGELGFKGVELRVSVLPDARAELRLEARGEKVHLPIRAVLHPNRKILAESANGAEPGFIIVSPHIPNDLSADYSRAGINHADLNGRLFIQTPHFLLERIPTKSRYRNPVPEPDLFAPKTSRIIRALLSDRDKSWDQEELNRRTQVSRGLVSKILTALVQKGYVERQSLGTRHGPARYRLSEFDRLLDAWAANDQWSKRVSIRQYSLLGADAVEIGRTVRDSLGADVVFTQWFAAHLRHPYTTPPLVTAYVPRKWKLPELRFAREVPTGGNLWLIVPEDEGVVFETQECSGFRLVSDVQIYLDLVQMGQRGPDAAQALRDWDGFAR